MTGIFRKNVSRRELALGTGAALVGSISPSAGAVATTVQRKLIGIVTPENFGAIGDGVADDTAAIISAYTASNSVELIGTYKITNTLTITNGCNFGGKNKYANIICAADVIAIRVLGGRIHNLNVTKTGTHTSNGVEVGSNTQSGSRSMLELVAVSGMGGDGIAIRNGNLGSIKNCSSANNGRDGFHFGKETVDINSWIIEGVNDISGNVRDGLHIESDNTAYASRAHQFTGIVSQSNGRYGVYVGTRQNIITAYCEANATADFYIDANGIGNEIRTTTGQVSDNGSKNLVVYFNPDGSYSKTIGVTALKFTNNGAHSTNSNTLDDYIEGTWTPVPSGLTVVGTPTYTGRYTKIGRMVHFTVNLSATTSVACTAGAAYFDVPFLDTTVNSGCWTCTAAANAANASFGIGIVGSSRCYPPTFSANASVWISGNYMADV